MTLTLKNFKGIRHFNFSPQGLNVNVFGANATGKTTLNDSITWLLFDKDSQNKTKFDIKTLDENNQEIHHLQHEVEAVLEVNERKINLHKIYKEVWSQKRGEGEAKFTGHTVDYYVDGVPQKKADYQKVIADIVKEDLFKLLTSPTFFNEQVEWKTRRATVIEVAGAVSDEEIIESNAKLKELPAILGERSIEDHKKVILSRQSKINEELKYIPVRIDEIRNGMPTGNSDIPTWNARLVEIEEKINSNNGLIHNITNGQSVRDKENEIKNLEYQLQDIQRKVEGDSKEKVFALQVKLQEEESNLNIMKNKGSQLVQNIESLKVTIQRKKALKSELLAQYNQINTTEFHYHGSDTCPTCSQSLPTEKVSEAIHKAEVSFKQEKSAKLERIEVDGKALKSEIEGMERELQQLEKDKDKQVELVNEKNKSLEKAKNDLETQKSNVVDVSEDAEYKSKLSEIDALRNDLKGIKENAVHMTSDLYKEIDNLQRERSELSVHISRFASIEASQKRIDELVASETKLTDEYKRLSKELFMLEQFVKTKVSILEDKIASKFKLARFKMFKENLNGGIEDTCEVMYNGVPFASLNNAMRINVGLDIINALSEHYGVRCPIFIDNAESVTDFIDVDAQIIRLVVSKADAELRMEEI